MVFNNPYTQVIKAQQAKFKSEYTETSLCDLPEAHVKTSDNINKTWGPWSFEVVEVESKVYYLLYHEAADYEIDLKQVNSTADVYGWIAHMTTKNSWHYGDMCVFFLCQAFEDICNQSNINLRTNNKDFNGAKVAATYYKRIQVKRNVSLRIRHQILERDDFRCLDCGASAITGAVLEVDHTIPISKGGSNDLSNLRTLCSDCNRGKSDRIVAYNPGI